jgi:hypothetical protein
MEAVMFLVSDTLESRQKKIRSFLEREPAIAVLLAAADFEWTVRRAILALGTNPTKDIRKDFERCRGLDGYKRCWKREVKPRLHVGLAQVVPNWQFLKEQAYDLRNRLIHGVSGPPSVPYARDRVVAMLEASAALVAFAACNEEPIYGRPIRRIKPRVIVETRVRTPSAKT